MFNIIQGRVINCLKQENFFEFYLEIEDKVYFVYTDNINECIPDYTLISFQGIFSQRIYAKNIIFLEDKKIIGDQLLVRTKSSSLQKPSVVSMPYLTQKVSKYIGIADNMSIRSFLSLSKLTKKYNKKAIYGCDLNVFFDEFNFLSVCSQYVLDCPLPELKLVVLDLETNGIDSFKSHILEIGYIVCNLDKQDNSFSYFINSNQKINKDIVELTGINNDMIDKDGVNIKTVLLELKEILDQPNSILLTHQTFDLKFLKQAFKNVLNLDFNPNFINTVDLFKLSFPEFKRFSLDYVCESLAIEHASKHRALSDARVTYFCIIEAFKKLEGIKKLRDIKLNVDYKSAKQFSVICYIQNNQGFLNLNKILTEANLNYFYKIPVIPLSFLLQNRNGLLLVSTTLPDSYIYEQYFFDGFPNLKIDFDYIFTSDYSSIQNENCIRNSIKFDSKVEDEFSVISKNSILNWYDSINCKKISMSPINSLSKIDKIALNTIRNIIRPKVTAKDDNCHIPIYHQNKIELEELVNNCNFNPNNLDLDLNTFSLEGDLTQVINDGLKFLYGKACENELLIKRIHFELNLLSKRNMQNIYYLVYRLVKNIKEKFNTIIGSRGSVGSSFLAFVLGLTEVNPLPPHKFCVHCGFLEKTKTISGFDIEKSNCECGKLLKRDGQNISFLIFSGLQGEKLPDIDLNIDSNIHDQVQEFVIEELNKIGYYSVRLSSVLCLQNKNALLYVDRLDPNLTEIEKSLAAIKLLDNHLSTTQHPGGILILPKNIDINLLTAVQKSSGEGKLVTHLDYNNLFTDAFKLDLLAHDDPAALVKLCEKTNVKNEDIDFLHPNILELFKNNQTLCLPDFGTKFVRRILNFLKPECFSELVKISGLTHGTNVWFNNGYELIQSGKTLSEIISVRDDIYDTLTVKFNIEESFAYEIMEFIRKGKAILEPNAWLSIVSKLNNVPEWYKDSCSKITYIFPRAHATAYTITALKIAYFKCFYIVCFYTCFLNRKITNITYEQLYLPVEEMKKLLIDLNLSWKQRDKAISQILEAVLEIKNNNIILSNIDIYNSEANEFIYFNNVIYPPFCIIKGFGSEGEKIVEARREKPFQNFLDFKTRTKITKSKLNMLLKNIKLPFDIIEENSLF